MDGTGPHLSQLLDHAASTRPGHAAVEDESGRGLTYAELHRQADRLATRLARWGVGRGDRVGLCIPKSLEAVAAIHGTLRSGAAYVPVDPAAPALRSAGIFADCGVKALVVAAELARALIAHWPSHGPLPRLIVIGNGAGDLSSTDAEWDDVLNDDTPSPLAPLRDPDDLAYILYTSGSTGVPKGVMLSHTNAFTFLDWCESSLDLRTDDRFSSHAPFHFDLSVFDLYAPCRVGATLVLIGESLGKEPARLGPFLSAKKLSVWYSAPSILALMGQYGGLEAADYSAPRVVLFAGEVFPILPLKRLRALWPDATFWNLYGPTETNVCTALRIPDRIAEGQTSPFPIGNVCPPLWARVVDETGREVTAGELGELVICGPGVMKGYFGRPELTEKSLFREGADAWYRTGDLVRDDGQGCYHFHGRRDRMVKKRGYRIELGEIESALYRHDGVDRAAVVAKADDSGVSIAAFVAMKPAHKGSVIAMKRHCTTYLPHYMIPDSITFLSDFPTTSTDKVDYQGLKGLTQGARAVTS